MINLVAAPRLRQLDRRRRLPGRPRVDDHGEGGHRHRRTTRLPAPTTRLWSRRGRGCGRRGRPARAGSPSPATQTEDPILVAIGGGGASAAGVARLGDRRRARPDDAGIRHANGAPSPAAAPTSPRSRPRATSFLSPVRSPVGGSAGVGVGVDVQVHHEDHPGLDRPSRRRSTVTRTGRSSPTRPRTSCRSPQVLRRASIAAVTVNAAVSVINVMTLAFIDAARFVTARRRRRWQRQVAADEATRAASDLRQPLRFRLGERRRRRAVPVDHQDHAGLDRPDRALVDPAGNMAVSAATGELRPTSIEEARFRPSTASTSERTSSRSRTTMVSTDGQKVVYYSGGDTADRGDGRRASELLRRPRGRSARTSCG